MVLEKLLNGTRNTWANLRVETLFVDNGITGDFAPGAIPPESITPGMEDQILRIFGGELTYQDQLVNSNLPDSVALVGSFSTGDNASIGNDLNVMGQLTVDLDAGITGALEAGSISSLGAISGASLSGTLQESDVAPGMDGQVLKTVGGVSAWVGDYGNHLSRFEFGGGAPLTISAKTALPFPSPGSDSSNGDVLYNGPSFSLVAGVYEIELDFSYVDTSGNPNSLLITLESDPVGTIFGRRFNSVDALERKSFHCKFRYESAGDDIVVYLTNGVGGNVDVDSGDYGRNILIRRLA